MRNILNYSVVFVALMVVALAVSPALAAYPGASDPTIKPPTDQSRIVQGSVLVLETIDTTNSIQQALTNLGVTFDLVSSDDWTGIDFGPYDIQTVRFTR